MQACGVFKNLKAWIGFKLEQCAISFVNKYTLLYGDMARAMPKIQEVDKPGATVEQISSDGKQLQVNQTCFQLGQYFVIIISRLILLKPRNIGWRMPIYNI